MKLEDTDKQMAKRLALEAYPLTREEPETLRLGKVEVKTKRPEAWLAFQDGRAREPETYGEVLDAMLLRAQHQYDRDMQALEKDLEYSKRDADAARTATQKAKTHFDETMKVYQANRTMESFDAVQAADEALKQAKVEQGRIESAHKLAERTRHNAFEPVAKWLENVFFSRFSVSFGDEFGECDH